MEERQFQSVLGALLLPLLLTSIANAEWDTFQGDAAHTGYTPGLLDATNTALLWRAPVSGTPFGLAVGGGNVLVSNSNPFTPSNVQSLNQASGSVNWTQSFNYEVTSNYVGGGPAYSNGNAYFQVVGATSAGTFLRVSNAQTGALIASTPYATQFFGYLNPTPFTGNIYIDGGGNDGIYSVNATTGTQNWFFNLGTDYDEWTPAVDQNYAYAYTGAGDSAPGGYFLMVNRSTGTLAALATDPNFSFPGRYSMNSAVVLGPHHDAFTINGGRILSWDTTLDATHTPHLAWAKTDAFTGQPTLAGGKIYAISNGALEALDESTGNALWTWSPPAGTSLTGPMIATDNTLFATTSNATFAIDLLSHNTDWSYPISGVLALSDDTLYVGAGDNAVWAFSVQSVPEPGSFAIAAIFSLQLLGRRIRKSA